MSVLISISALEARRQVAAGPLASLAASLTADLAVLRGRDLYFPRDKARLSREGGRCARDGTLLTFDPFEPHVHRCPRCGVEYRGEAHDRFWIYWYQLWLAERAVHGAVLARLGGGDWCAELAASILEGYAARYDDYPNVDNVLGPTRVFFSTYLESIWLLQICIAADLVRTANPSLFGRVCDRIIEPSRRIIAEFDEGASNRQVWNDVALLAAARLLDDGRSAEHAVRGSSGLVAQLAGGLLSDGTWYEGENYHLFAHRGLWYGVTMARAGSLELPGALLDRFDRGFAAPFATALPDFTLPSRRDSQYAISLRQWRIAEHCELGLARIDDPALIGALYRMYCDPVARGDTGRAASSADVERNAPPSALTRADLSWRALLFARPELPPLEPLPPRSALLTGQGIAVFRRDDARTYAALDYGHAGGGHGHPDRLNLLLARDDTRWLDDFGTGSYVDPSLHWYRSTLAHNAPLVDGHSQAPADGWLLAYDERGAAGWIRAGVQDASTGTRLQRTLIVMPGYLIDLLEWKADRIVTVDLPLHADIALADAGPVRTERLIGGTGTEDGFAFLEDPAVQRVASGQIVHGVATGAAEDLRLWSISDADAEWWRATAPGAPGHGAGTFRIVRARGAIGVHRTVLDWSCTVASVELGDGIRVMLHDGTTHVHRPAEHGWTIELLAGAARSSIDLVGAVGGGAPPDMRVATREQGVAAHSAEGPAIRVPSSPRSVRIELGEAHYRRSEQTWRDAGQPAARIEISARPDATTIVITVERSELAFAAADAVNPYDNELPDVNGDGVQLYVQARDGLACWMLVPEISGERVRVRPIEGGSLERPLVARWEHVESGYRLFVELPGPRPMALDVLVNEMPRSRERRRGQLVLSGAAGEFVYLRGDRHDADRLLPLRYEDD